MSPPTYAAKADFVSDYVTEVKRLLHLRGVRVPTDATDEDLSRVYWNAALRHIDVRPRQVHLASDFMEPEDATARAGLAALLVKVESGHDLNPHLSKATKDSQHPAFNDLLLNDWGIHHFHLGEDAGDQKRFSGRTDLLLYAMVKPTAVYCIRVLPHGHWADLKLLEAVHRNWPHLLTRIEGVEGTEISEKQLRVLRKKRGMVVPKMGDGAAYVPAGGGYTASGQNFQAIRMSDRCFDAAGQYQRVVAADADSIAAQILDQSGRQPNNPMLFRMEIDIGMTEAHALEETSRARFPLGPFPLPLR